MSPAIVHGQETNDRACLCIDGCDISSTAGPPLYLGGQTVTTDSTIRTAEEGKADHF
jgi:hypothetical protein